MIDILTFKKMLSEAGLSPRAAMKLSQALILEEQAAALNLIHADPPASTI